MTIKKAGFLPVNLYFMDSILPDLVTNEGEAGTRGFHVVFYDGENQVISPSGFSARCYGYNKKTKKTYYREGVSSGNGWDLEVPPEAITEKGEALVQVVLLEGDAVRIKSKTSPIRVGLSLDSGSISGGSVYVDYDILKEFTEKAKVEEDKRQSQEKERQAEEEKRKAQEKTREEGEAKREEQEAKREAQEGEREKKIKEAEDAAAYILSDDFSEKVQEGADPLHVGDEEPEEEVKRLWLDTDENGPELVHIGPRAPEEETTPFWIDTEDA